VTLNTTTQTPTPRLQDYKSVSILQQIGFNYDELILAKGLGAIRAKIGPTSDVDRMLSKMCSQYELFRNKYS
jgi:hypothetical protein